MADYKKLRGRRILVTKPVAKEHAFELDATTKASIEAEMMVKWTNLEVYAVGEDVTEVAPGDLVYLSTYSIQQAEIVEVGGALRLMLQEGDVSIIW